MLNNFLFFILGGLFTFVYLKYFYSLGHYFYRILGYYSGNINHSIRFNGSSLELAVNLLYNIDSMLFRTLSILVYNTVIKYNLTGFYYISIVSVSKSGCITLCKPFHFNVKELNHLSLFNHVLPFINDILINEYYDLKGPIIIHIKIIKSN